MKQVLVKKLNSPMTSSVGRRFDAVAALAGLCDVSGFEGQAAMALEFALPAEPSDKAYSFRVVEGKGSPRFIIQAPVWDELLDDVKKKVLPGEIAAKFHNMLAEVIVWAARTSKMERVALTGGCFQNRYLTERSVMRLREEGFKAYWHQRVPPNDGGIALGQVLAAARQ
jgi:hydrogenase maturation protein HypF